MKSLNCQTEIFISFVTESLRITILDGHMLLQDSKTLNQPLILKHFQNTKNSNNKNNNIFH